MENKIKDFQVELMDKQPIQSMWRAIHSCSSTTEL